MSVSGYVRGISREIRDTFAERDPDAYIEAYTRFYERRAASTGEDAAPATAAPATAAAGGADAPASAEAVRYNAQAELMGELYKNLDTLDGKASGLLTYCGLVLAGSSFLVDRANEAWIALWSVVVVALAAVSAFFAVQAIFLAWTPAYRLRDHQVGEACRQYYEVRQRRTRFYLVSWLAITISTIMFLVGLVAEYLDDATGIFDRSPTPVVETGGARIDASGGSAAPGADETGAGAEPPEM
jgi:hypothetical protein